jgi:hypothetical protein
MYSSDPELDAQRHFDKVYVYEERVQAAELAMSTAFVNLAMRGDAGAAAPFAPETPDYSKGIADSKTLPKRAQRLHECIREAMEYMDAEQELMQLVINAATGLDVKADAQKFIADCASKFAAMNVDVGDDE